MRPILRFDILKFRESLTDEPHHEELFTFKDKSFGSTEELIKATKDVLGPISDQYTYKLPSYPDYPVVNRMIFTYLYEKFDAIYNQELISLTSQDKVDIEGKDYQQTLSRLRDLIKCEQIIDSTSEPQAEFAKDLVSLLEMFFCHPEHLDALLLLLTGKTNDQDTLNDITLLHRKIYNFMTPFMRLYGKDSIDVLEIWKNRKNPHKFEHLLEDIIVNLKTLLETNTQLTQDEIKTLCEDIKALKDDIQDRRNLIQRLYKEKKAFKDEGLYYYLLGEISCLLHLQCLNTPTDKEAIPFLRMGMITNLYIVKYVERKNNQEAPIKTNFDQLISGTNFDLKLRSPSQVLEVILSELTNNWSDDFLQLLELHLHVISKLHTPIYSLYDNKEIDCENEYYNLFFQEERSNLKDKDSLWRRLYKLVTSNADNLISKDSYYFINGSLYESLLYGWVDMIDGVAYRDKTFLIMPGNYFDSIKPEYYSLCLSFLNQIINLVLDEKCLAKQLSKYVQNYLIGFGQRIVKCDKKLLGDLDLEKIYGVAEKEAIQYVSTLEKILSNESDSKLDANPNFSFILQLLADWISTNRYSFGEALPKTCEFIDKIMSSQFVEQLFEHYKGEKRWLDSIKDTNALLNVLQIMKFMTKMIFNNKNILDNEEKRVFVRSMWMDVMCLDFISIPKIFQVNFFNDLAEILDKHSVFRIWGDKKFVFVFVKYALFLPKVERYEANYRFPFMFMYLVDSEEKARPVTQLFIRIIDKCEEKMRNPLIDLWESLNQLEKELDKEEATEEKTQLQQNGVTHFIGDLKILENKKLYEKSVETVMQFLDRTQYLANHILVSQQSQLRDIKEEVQIFSRKVVKMMFSPILMLAPEKFPSEFMATKIFTKVPLAGIAEGMCEGVINLCTEYGLTENLNIDHVKFGEMMLRITKYGYIKPQDILKDLTWREAALASLYLAINQFGPEFDCSFESIFCPSPEFSTKLRHASSLLLKVTNQIEKAQYELLTKNEISLSNFDKISTTIRNRISEWGNMTIYSKKDGQFISDVEEIYLSSLDGLELNQNKAHNLNIIKSLFSLVSSDETTKTNITSRLLTNITLFERILSLLKATINDALNGPNTNEQILISSLLSEMDKFLNKEIMSVDNLSSALGDSFEKFKSEIKDFLKVALDFLSQIDLRKVISHKDDSIITKVGHNLEFLEELFKVFRDISKEKLDKISQNIEQAQSEADSNKIEELEKEKITIREEYKHQINTYLKAFLPHALYFKDLQGSVSLMQEFSSISQEHLIGEHDKIYKATLEYIWGLLDDESDTYLKGELTEEIKNINTSSEKLASFDRTSTCALNQAVTLEIYLKSHSRFMDVNDVSRGLKISSNFMVGLVTVINSLLKRILASDLAQSQRDNQTLKIDCVVGYLVDYVGNLATKYIVAQTITNLASYEEITNPKQGSLQKVLLAALEMTDLSLSVNDVLLEKTKTTILDAVPSCFESLLNLTNSVLRSNKALRVLFLNNGTLEKLLTTRKLKFSDEKSLKSLLSLLATILEANLPIDTKKVDDIKQLQEIVSPIAQKCIQTLLKVLLQNCRTETESSAHFQKKVQKERDNKAKQKERLENNRDDLISLLKDVDEEELTEQEKAIPLRDVSLIVKAISGIMLHQPHLVSYIMLQEMESKDTHALLQDTGKYSVLDVLMRIFLRKDGDCALLIAGSVIEKNDIEVKDSQGNKTQAKNLFLAKILSIAQELLDKEDALGQGMKTFESMLMGCNIGRILAYVGSRVETDFSNKRVEIQTIIVNIVQKLLKDMSLLASIINRLTDEFPLLNILSEIVNKNMEGCLGQTDLREKYVGVLRTIEEGHAENLNQFDVNYLSALNEHVFRVKEDLTKKEIHIQDQKVYEKLEEKDQWQRLETRKIRILANIEKDNDIVPDIDLPSSRIIGNQVPISKLGDFFGAYEREKTKNLEERYNYLKFLDYLQSTNDTLQSLSPPYPQTLGYPEDTSSLPSIFRYSDEKYRELNTNSIRTEEIGDTNNSAPLNENVDSENKQENEIEQANDKPNKEEQPVEEEKSKQELEEENEEASIRDSQDKRIRYFYSDDIRSERHLKFKVNQALKKARILKESICTEKTLRKLTGKGLEGLDIEEMVKKFIQNLTGFDRNVVYIGLGREIKETLSESMRKTINKLEKVFNSIKEDYDGFKTAFEEVKNSQVQMIESQDEEASLYDDLEDELVLPSNEEEVNSNDVNILGQEATNQSFNKEISEETKKVVRSLKFSDDLVLRFSSLFFASYKKYDSLPCLTKLAREVLGPNPVNELRLLDTLLFVLYTPELLESDAERNGIDFPPKKFITSNQKFNPLGLYKEVAKNIILYFETLISSSDKSYVFLTPVKYLNKFGNRLLDTLKAKVNFQKKVSECYSILDMVIGLLEISPIIQTGDNASNILNIVKEIIYKEKPLTLGEGDPQKVNLDSYNKYFSAKSLNILLGFLNVSNKKDSEMARRVEELLYGLVNTPEVFTSVQDCYINWFSNSVSGMNKFVEENIKTIKESIPNTISENRLKQVVEEISEVNQLKIIKIILSAFSGVFKVYLLTEAKNNTGKYQQVSQLLRNVVKHISKEANQAFIINLYELLEVVYQAKKSLGLSTTSYDHPLIISELLVYYHSIITIGGSIEGNTNLNSLFGNFGLKYSHLIAYFSQTSDSCNHDAASYFIINLLLPKFPWILDLQNKKSLIRNKLSEYLSKFGVSSWDSREIIVDKNKSIRSILSQFKNQPKQEILKSLTFNLIGEEIYDTASEFYKVIIQNLFNPDLGLFCKLNDNTLQPNVFSSIIPNHLQHFEFAGLMIAKAFQGYNEVNVSLTKPLLKLMLGKQITLTDLEDVDVELCKKLQSILDNEIKDQNLNFTQELEIFGEKVILELIEGGANTLVTENNKKEYVNKVCEARIIKPVEAQIKHFLKGFHTILPQKMISHLSPSELNLLITETTQEINLEEFCKCFDVKSDDAENNLVKWFWEVVNEFRPDDLTNLLYFISGTPKLSSDESQKITISKSSNKSGLPVAHKSFREIVLPEYSSKEELRDNLLLALTQ